MPSNSGNNSSEKNISPEIPNAPEKKPRSDTRAGDIFVSKKAGTSRKRLGNRKKATTVEQQIPDKRRLSSSIAARDKGADATKIAEKQKEFPQPSGKNVVHSHAPIQKKNMNMPGNTVTPLRPVGDFFYTVGFYTQSAVMRGWRVMRNAGMFAGNVLSVVFSGAGRRFYGFFHGIATDIASPFVRVRKNMRLRVQARKSENPGVGPRRSRDYRLLTVHVFRIVLPMAAAATFFITVGAALSQDYALAVEVNGNLIGYVTDETVIDDAGDLLRMKLSLAPDQSVSDWQFSPALHMATADKLSNKTQMADKILENSSNTIIKGTGVYVDGVLMAATTDGEALKNYLEEFKGKYADAMRPDAEVSFVRDVRVPDTEEVFLQESVKDIAQIEQLLSRQVEPELVHTVKEGETLAGIALEHGITVDLLKIRNPVVAGEKDTFEPEENALLLIRPAEHFLQVKLTYRELVEEELPYETETIENDTMVIGYKKTVTTGENGVASVPYEYVYIDGEYVSQLRIEEEKNIIKEPVNAVIEVGTKEPVMVLPGGGTGGTGQFIFPVPGSTYSTRGFTGSHHALDLNAVTGSPIYAADGGTVIFSGWRGLYGNCVEIDHGNGFKTLYAHNSALSVSPGQSVGRGQLIGYVGATGNASGPHCHFELRLEGQKIDPYNYVPWPYNVPWR